MGLKMGDYVVYKHTSPSGKVYIGITSLDVHRRWRSNGEGYKGQPFYNAIKKYGWENISHEILFKNLTEEEAKLMEQMYIALYDSTNSKYGYNAHFGGGDFPRKTRRVICLNIKLKTKEEFESVLDASIKTGCSVPNISSCCSNRQNMTINNSKEILIWMYYEDYIKLNKNQIEKIIKEKTKKRNSYVCLNTKEIFFTATDAAKKYNTSRQEIGKVCLNKSKTSGKDKNGNKLVWAYYRDYIKMTDEEIKEKIRQAYERNIEYTKGEKFIENARKLGIKNKCRKHSLAEKKKQREIMIERWKNNEDWIQKMKERSLKNSGINNPKSRKVICLNNKKVFECITEAQKWALNSSKISDCCQGKRKTAGRHPITGESLKWMYYEDYLKSK